MTLDLDEIARRRVRHDGDVGLSQGDFVMITPAERDWLVERAREAMRAQDGYVPPPVRLPEMPADVAGMVETLRQFANELSSPTIDDAATMIESLAGQRQEQDAWRANVEVKLRVTRQALNDAEARAKQAEKERDDWRHRTGEFNTALTAAESRLAKLEAVVRKARLYAKYPIPGRLRELNDALAALDRKEPKT